MASGPDVRQMSSSPRKAGRHLLLALLAICVFVVLPLLLIPAIRSGPPARIGNCSNNLKQIAIALFSYREAEGTFPPAYIADSNGKPMHSWRVLILPYFEFHSKDLYDQYDFDEPWDGPNNRRLSDKMPGVFGGIYRCPTADATSHETNYVAVVGPDALWRRAETISLEDVGDGPSKTILLVEVGDSGINWMEPGDLSFDEARIGINPRGKKLSISSKHPGGASVLFADGHVRFLENEISPDVLQALLTPNGGEEVNEALY
jgi:prepilin-type processing-associated H-X9-DG protein